MLPYYQNIFRFCNFCLQKVLRSKKTTTKTAVCVCCSCSRWHKKKISAPWMESVKWQQLSKRHSPLWPAATWTPRIARWLGRSRSPPAVCTGCSWRKSQRRACALLLKWSLLSHREGHGKHFTSTFPRLSAHSIKNAICICVHYPLQSSIQTFSITNQSLHQRHRCSSDMMDAHSNK